VGLERELHGARRRSVEGQRGPSHPAARQ
jgi:hypothetical protein